MLNLVAVLIIVVAAILAHMTAGRLVCGWLKYRGRMVVTCPENQRPAVVSVDARHARGDLPPGSRNFTSPIRPAGRRTLAAGGSA